MNYCHNFIKRSDITYQDIQQTKLILQQSTHGLLENQCNPNKHNQTNECIVTVVALARTYGMPLLTWIVDIYHRMLVNHWIATNGKLLVPKQFSDNFLLIQSLKQTDRSLYNIFAYIVPAFHKNCISFPEIASTQWKYDDDINDYIEIVTNINKSLRGIVNHNNSSDLTSPYPAQLDVWIVPYNVVRDDDYDNDGLSESDDEQYTNKDKLEAYFSKFMNCVEKLQRRQKRDDYIKKRLRLSRQNGLISNFSNISVSRKDMAHSNVVKTFIEQKIAEMNPYKRYILIIDRRKRNKNNINLYFYEAPKGQNTISEHHSYLRCTNIINSKCCVLPQDPTADVEDKPRDIGLMDFEAGYMFGLSYHINNYDSIACYWTTHGSAIRTFATDMRDIWPHYFVRNSNNTNQIVNISQWDEFQDFPFESFYKLTSGHTDLYERNSDPFHNVIKHQTDISDISQIDDKKCELKPVVDDNCIQLNYIASDYQKTQREIIVDKIMKLQTNYPDAVQLTIENIKSRFDENECDPEDIIEDISEGSNNSELLFNLIQNGISINDALKFGKDVQLLLL